MRADHLRLALEAAVRAGGDTDTVAAIAGGLLGAVYGASAVPSHWRLVLQGWPSLKARGLIRLADDIIDRGRPDRFDYTYAGVPKNRRAVRHPHDEKVWIGGIAALSNLPDIDDALRDVLAVLPGADPNTEFRAALRRLHPTPEGARAGRP